jgi:GDP-L-fucose synthase
MPSPHALVPSSSVYVAGHRGLVGGAVTRALQARGVPTVQRTSAELDLRDRARVFAFLRQAQPTHVILAAARVGGIVANATEPADFLSDNLQIQLNVMDAARELQVPRLLFLGSSCIYPRDAPQPISESSLLTGPLESTNDAYAIAKIAGVLQVQAVRRQDGLAWISAMPTNLYGPGDNFDLEKSHVLPGMIRRMHEAKQRGDDRVVLWGSGSPRREFLHVDDAADAVLHLLESYDEPAPINVGVGEDLTVRELAERVQEVVGYRGELVWDTARPDGTPRKLLDVSRLTATGWTARTPLADGIRSTYAWFLENEIAGLRGRSA